MYIWGEFKKDIILNGDYVNELIETSQSLHHELRNISILQIIDVLDSVGTLWSQNTVYHKKALKLLEAEGHFSNQLNEMTLNYIPELLKKENLLKRIKAEVQDLDVLDEFVSKKEYKGRVHYSSLGVLLHVTAGNVFLSCIDSIILGCLTKNISLVKLSSSNLELPFLFMESFQAADEQNILSNKISLLTWKGGDKKIEPLIKNKVHAIIAWGGEEMIKSYKKDLDYKVRFIEHGARISFHVITHKYFLQMNEKSYHNIAHDVALWDQQACANSQNIFLEVGVNRDDFMKKLSIALESYPIAPRILSADESVERLKQKEKALYSEYKTKQHSYIEKSSIVFYESSPYLAPSGLNRSVIIRSFNSLADLSSHLYPLSHFIQTCGLCTTLDQRDSYLRALSQSGVDRFTREGEMLSSLAGSPHDGNYPLMELLRVVCDELIETAQEFALNTTKDLPFYDGANNEFSAFDQLPLVSGADLLKSQSDLTSEFLNQKLISSGFVFSSGGTSGNPKYCFYRNEEFDRTSELLAASYKSLGLIKGSLVANLFVAGNMWSSFSAVQDALKKCEVIQFPMGGLIDVQDFKAITQNFGLDVIFGIPGIILDLANRYPDLKINKIFYAGESFSKAGLSFLEKNWGCTEVHSAGYACVDVGPIGYQDKTCSRGEHILFSEYLHLEVIDGEGVVTSKIRKAQPVIRYRTGDRVEILPKIKGFEDQVRFKLLERVDMKFSIWSARIEVSDLDQVIGDKEFQLQIYFERYKDRLLEKLQINLLELPASGDELLARIYEKCTDLRQSISFELFRANTQFSEVFIHNKRTGKVKKILDQR